MFCLPKRQTLSQSSFINLNDIDACLLQILYFILNCQSNLVAGFESWLVISNKGPVENGNRASKHSLHWALGHALSSTRPEDSHGFGPAHITIDDGWLHTARSIRLNPSIGSEGKPRKLLPKVLNHIIPLLSMNQNINVQLFLELNNFANFFLDGLNILLLRNPTNLVFTANPSKFHCLRE
nr:Uncharacterised protein [Ipomoea batatas]